MTLAQIIKKELKAAGIDTKLVSVKNRKSLYDTAVDITINSLDIDIKSVEAIANKYESIDRDEYNGEILMGGNTFINVRYAWDLFRGTWLFEGRAVHLAETYGVSVKQVVEMSKGTNDDDLRLNLARIQNTAVKALADYLTCEDDSAEYWRNAGVIDMEYQLSEMAKLGELEPVTGGVVVNPHAVMCYIKSYC